MSDEKNTKDIAKLRHDVDILKQKLRQPAGRHIYKTDFSSHIAELDRDIKKRESQSQIKAVNAFTLEQQVKLSGDTISLHAIAPGTIKYIACKLATPSFGLVPDKEGKMVRACDKRTCSHANKNFIWVEWSSKKTYVYRFDQLQLMTVEDLKPRIGKELSGRIGEWTYDADNKLWKRDSNDKQYTNEEFENVVYWEMHPFAKDEGKDFIKALNREQQATKEIEAIK